MLPLLRGGECDIPRCGADSVDVFLDVPSGYADGDVTDLQSNSRQDSVRVNRFDIASSLP